MKRRSLHIGDICKSRFFASIELRSVPVITPFASFGKTYNGTTHGFCAGLGRIVLVMHTR